MNVIANILEKQIGENRIHIPRSLAHSIRRKVTLHDGTDKWIIDLKTDDHLFLKNYGFQSYPARHNQFSLRLDNNFEKAFINELIDEKEIGTTLIFSNEKNKKSNQNSFRLKDYQFSFGVIGIAGALAEEITHSVSHHYFESEHNILPIELVGYINLMSRKVKALIHRKWGKLTCFWPNEAIKPETLKKPFISYDRHSKRFVAATNNQDSIAKQFKSHGFKLDKDGCYSTKQPSDLLDLIHFCDPWLKKEIEKINLEWPLAFQNFNTDDFEIASQIDGSNSDSKYKKNSKSKEIEIVNFIDYDEKSNFLVTSHILYAKQHGFKNYSHDAALLKRPLFQICEVKFENLAKILYHKPHLSEEAQFQTLCLQIENPERTCFSEIIIPNPRFGEKYDLVQIEAIQHILSMKVTSLCDDMGLGKTYSGTGVIAAMFEKKPESEILVVCPAGQRDNWERTLLKVIDRKFKIIRNDSYTKPHFESTTGASVEYLDKNNNLTDENSQGAVFLYSYESCLQDIRIQDRIWDLTLYDESHSAKNPKAKRTKILLPDSHDLEGIRSLHHVSMTGTEQTLNAGDLYPFLRRYFKSYKEMSFKGTLVSKSLPNFARFKQILNGSGASENLDIQLDVKSKRLQRLAQALDQGPRLRRLKKLDYQKIRSVIEINTDDKAVIKAGEEEQKLFAQLQALENKPSSFADKLKIRGSISQLRKITGYAKKDPVCKILAQRAETQKIILFTYHTALCDAYAETLKQQGLKILVSHGGNETPSQRQKTIDLFQNSDYQIYVTTIDASYMGYTINKAHVVAMCEMHYEPHKIVQAEDRAWRRGVQHDVEVLYFIIKRSFDGLVVQNMTKKMKDIDILNNDAKRRLNHSVDDLNKNSSYTEEAA